MMGKHWRNLVQGVSSITSPNDTQSHNPSREPIKTTKQISRRITMVNSSMDQLECNATASTDGAASPSTDVAPNDRPVILGSTILSVHQKHLLILTWRHMNRSTSTGGISAVVYSKMFNQQPDLHTILKKADVVGRMTKSSANLITEHRQFLIDLFDMAIKSLDSIEVVDARCIEIGRIHALVAENQTAFNHHSWDLFGSAMMEVVTQVPEIRKHRDLGRMAWMTLISYLFDKIKQGHVTRMKQMKFQHQQSLQVRELASKSLTAQSSDRSVGTEEHATSSSVLAVGKKHCDQVEIMLNEHCHRPLRYLYLYFHGLPESKFKVTTKMEEELNYFCKNSSYMNLRRKTEELRNMFHIIKYATKNTITLKMKYETTNYITGQGLKALLWAPKYCKDCEMTPSEKMIAAATSMTTPLDAFSVKPRFALKRTATASEATGPVYDEYRQQRRKFERNPIITQSPFQEIQADIGDLGYLKH